MGKIKYFNTFELNENNSTNDKWLKPWRVIDLREVCQEISGKNSFDKHPIYKEWEYQIHNRSKGNDKANLEWVGANEKTPLINDFLLKNGFEKDEMVMYWVCW